MKKISPRTAMMVVVAALVVYAIYTQTIGKTSAYAVTPNDYAPVGVDLAPSSPDSAPVVSDPSCEMKAGTGLASSLLPPQGGYPGGFWPICTRRNSFRSELPLSP